MLAILNSSHNIPSEPQDNHHNFRCCQMEGRGQWSKHKNCVDIISSNVSSEHISQSVINQSIEVNLYSASYKRTDRGS